MTRHDCSDDRPIDADLRRRSSALQLCDQRLRGRREWWARSLKDGVFPSIDWEDPWLIRHAEVCLRAIDGFELHCVLRCGTDGMVGAPAVSKLFCLQRLLPLYSKPVPA